MDHLHKELNFGGDTFVHHGCENTDVNRVIYKKFSDTIIQEEEGSIKGVAFIPFCGQVTNRTLKQKNDGYSSPSEDERCVQLKTLWACVCLLSTRYHAPVPKYIYILDRQEDNCHQTARAYHLRLGNTDKSAIAQQG